MNQKSIPKIAALGLFIAFWFTLIDAIGNISISFDGDGSSANLINEDSFTKRIAEEFAKSQNKIIESHSESMDAPNPADMTGVFTVAIAPFSFSDGSSAKLTLLDQTVDMALKDGVFTGSAKPPLNAVIAGYRITLRQSGETSNETIALENNGSTLPRQRLPFPRFALAL